MKKYDTNTMLELWSQTSINSNDPYPAPEGDDKSPEDLANDINATSDMTTASNGPNPMHVSNMPGADKKKLDIIEAEVPTKDKIPTSGEVPQQMDPASAAVDPSAMQDPSIPIQSPDMSGDPNAMMGMPALSGPTSTFDVGRVYELKKIYSRLVSMQSYLSGTTDPNLIKLRNYVSSTMDLFRTLISNVSLYKDRLDEIIVVFYKVVDNVYDILSKYYKDKDSGKMIQAVEGKVIDYLSLKYGQHKEKKL